jgi:hypothetical protein
MKTFWADCTCGTPEHNMQFCYVPNPHEDDPPELYVNVFLVKYGFFRRLWTAIKYVFGHKSRYGHWDGMELSRESVQELRGWLDEYIATFDDWQARRNVFAHFEDRYLEIHAAFGALMQGAATEFVIHVDSDDVQRLGSLCQALLHKYPSEYWDKIEVLKTELGVRIRLKPKT